MEEIARGDMPSDSAPTQTVGYGLENAYGTLMAGFTAIQSVGRPIDRDVCDAIDW